MTHSKRAQENRQVKVTLYYNYKQQLRFTISNAASSADCDEPLLPLTYVHDNVVAHLDDKDLKFGLVLWRKTMRVSNVRNSSS